MREVRECDFCGADATGVYDVLPAEVGERRVLLCDGCRETLTSVVDPLVDALEGERPGGDPAVEHGDATDAAGDDESDASDWTAAAGDGGARASGTGSGSGSGSASGGSSAKRTRKGAPRGYRKVLRFLENREFPMDRAEAEGMVADAYDLDREQVAAVLDHAIKHGRLREASGELRR